MTASAKLPTGYTLCRAHSIDKWAIINIRRVSPSKTAPLQNVPSRFLRVRIITRNVLFLRPYILLLALQLNGLLLCITHIIDSSLIRSLIYLFGVIVTGCGSLVVTKFLINFFNPQYWTRCWVIEYSGRLVAYGKLSRYNNHSILDSLYVAPGFRFQGLGSCLVQRLVQEATKPLYLYCLPELCRFYNRFGFVLAAKQNLPRHNILWRIAIISPFLPLVMTDATIPPSNSIRLTDETNSLPSLSSRWIVRQAHKRDRWRISWLFFNSSRPDSFLPFGITPSQPSPIKVLLLSLLRILLLSLVGISLLWLICILTLNGLSIWLWIVYPVAVFLIVLILRASAIAPLLRVQNWSQFYIVESLHGKLLSHARLSRHKRYSVLDYLYIPYTDLNLTLTTHLMRHLLQQVNRPIYLGCQPELVNFYTDFGFIPVTTSALPYALQSYASANLKVGGTNLVLR